MAVVPAERALVHVRTVVDAVALVAVRTLTQMAAVAVRMRVTRHV